MNQRLKLVSSHEVEEVSLSTQVFSQGRGNRKVSTSLARTLLILITCLQLFGPQPCSVHIFS